MSKFQKLQIIYRSQILEINYFSSWGSFCWLVFDNVLNMAKFEKLQIICRRPIGHLLFYNYLKLSKFEKLQIFFRGGNFVGLHHLPDLPNMGYMHTLSGQRV